MNTVTQQFVKLLCAILLSTPIFSNAQVGIGTTSHNADAELDITSTTRGLLLPRVALTNTTNPNPLSTDVAGMTVYNTATAGDVTPGFYYNDGSLLIRLGAAVSADWSLTGNAGTTAGTNFIGTTDAQDIVIKANSLERVRVGTSETVFNETSDNNYNFRIESADESSIFTVAASTNHVYIRQPSPFPTIDMFISTGAAGIYPVNGYATGQNNSGIYGRTATIATGTNMNSGGAFDGTGTAAGFSSQDGWNVGVVATGDEAGVFGSTTTGSLNAQGGYFEEGFGGTVYATARIAGYDNTGSYDYGGYFDGGTGSDYAFVGFNDGATDFKIQGPGSVSTIVKDNENEDRVLFCPETPEIIFQDYGVGKLTNGEAYIKIDPILSKNIFVDKKHPLKVFIQLEGDCKGVYVTHKSDKGFRVKELQGGHTNVSFSWSLTATRADRYTDGKLASKHVDIRFPKGQKRIVPSKSKQVKVSKSYNANKSDRARK